MKSLNYGIALPYISARTIATLYQAAEESGWDSCFTGDAIWCEDPIIALAGGSHCVDRVVFSSLTHA